MRNDLNTPGYEREQLRLLIVWTGVALFVLVALKMLWIAYQRHLESVARRRTY